MKRRLVLVIAILASLCDLCALYAEEVHKILDYNGNRDGASLNINFITPTIIRVRYALTEGSHPNNTGVCLYEGEYTDAKIYSKEGKETTLSSGLIEVAVNNENGSFVIREKKSGRILFFTSNKAPFYAQRVAKVDVKYDEASARVEHTANGDVTIKDILSKDTIGFVTQYRLNFNFQEGEALYGLGAHMEDYMNLRGKTMYLTQHNLKAMVPVLNSTNGYGLLFDAGCVMKFCDTKEESYMELEAAGELDMYIMVGDKMDDIIKQYRLLTGKSPMMPKYMFGYIQSKERYVSQDELVGVLREYRRRHVPIDMIVQDWSYWPEGWGYMKMDSKFFPNPKAMADSVHAMNAKLMISIWPNPQYCPQERDFSERGYMLKQSVYDVFNPKARDYYWSYANNEFFSKGFDAWWCDCSEPLDGDWKNMGEGYGIDNQEERWHLNMDILSASMGEERSSLYSLYHARGIYENQRKTTSEKRVVNLTRSSYAGQQRYATITWNGDTHASWRSFKQQIPAGLNFMATGCPYWSVDIGSFFTRGNDQWHRWFYCGEFEGGVASDAYREYYTRMLQWGTFLPMMRSHGTDTPREIWRFGEPGTKYYDAILKMIKLRYSLLPYIYSNAWRITNSDYTMCRLLAFDFATDNKVLDIKDEYMFGDAILVCPVTDPNVTSREVYLPQGCEWIDYWTGKRYAGGVSITAYAPIDILPLFVKAGSIIVTGPDIEYSSQKTDMPLEINVYSGKDATFDLYEDEGDNYNCEQGQYSIIPMKWDNKRKRLTIGKQIGTYNGCLKEREFVINIDGKSNRVKYNGREITVK
ncbi:MAG: glycoside hydrolase family 31 protein [Bacteroidia bacterium]|nr:glycoside hydrolase family 31 protein [Bacteroidia bacterium]